MKATGIVRRIDDLGRVVIPKEIRRTMRIREGDPLEIYTSREGEVIFKKYSQLGGVDTFATELCEAVNRTCSIICAISDRDSIIAVAGGAKRELLSKPISQDLEQILSTRKPYQYTGQGRSIAVSDNSETLLAAVIAPIISEGDVLGSVILVGEQDTATSDTELTLAQTFAAFLGKHMES